MRTQEWGTPGAPGHPRTEEWDADSVVRTGRPDHTLALELVRVTEAAAIAAGRWVGHDDGNRGKAAAVDAMHRLIRSVSMRGVVVIGEGAERDAPALFAGEDVGDGAGPACDIGISAGDGALSADRDVPDSLAAIVVAEPGALYDPPPGLAMEKLAVGPECADVVDIDRPVAENLRAIAAAKGIAVSDVVVAVLNRSRHQDLVRAVREAGARVHLLQGGDIAGAIAPALCDSPVDVLLGVGGATEGVLAAAALSCLGGTLQVRLRPGDAPHSAPVPVTGGDFDTVLHTDDLVRGASVVFCATGVTSNEVLRGVAHHPIGATTHSVVLCSDLATVWMVESEHPQARWREHEEHGFA